MSLKAIVFFLTILSTAAPASPQKVDQSEFGFSERPGTYSVGLKVVEQFDYSRSFRPLIDDLGKKYDGERARPLQTLIWYPAQKNNTSDTQPQLGISKAGDRMLRKLLVCAWWKERQEASYRCGGTKTGGVTPSAMDQWRRV